MNKIKKRIEYSKESYRKGKLLQFLVGGNLNTEEAVSVVHNSYMLINSKKNNRQIKV